MGLLVNLMPREAMGAGREGSHSQARATAGLMSSPTQATPQKGRNPFKVHGESYQKQWISPQTLSSEQLEQGV